MSSKGAIPMPLKASCPVILYELILQGNPNDIDLGLGHVLEFLAFGLRTSKREAGLPDCDLFLFF